MNALLAEVNAFQVVSQYLNRTRDPHDYTLIILVLSGILGVWLLLNWLEDFRVRSRLHAQSVEALFQELCQLHRLSRSERQTLAQASQSLNERCCEVFIDPRILGKLSVARIPDADNYANLARKLFGTSGG